jgi:glycosyltransferase involved in cell wall biosynthesis
MPKILFIAAHRKDRSPSQRFRFEQYISYLESNSFQCELSNLLSEKDDKIVYSKGKILHKTYILFKTFFKRILDFFKSFNVDVIFIQREAFMLGTPFFERLFKLSGAKIIFDFDDAIWKVDTSTANKNFEWLKSGEKTSSIIKLSNLVIAGNKFLEDYAKKHNQNTFIIPTTIDLGQYQKIAQQKDKVVIGWSGSITTIKHFSHILNVLKAVHHKFKNNIDFCVIGDGNYRNDDLNIIGKSWNKEDEIIELSKFDIGIMPLPNDEWAKGKCGLKGLQYMALQIPTIMSPVGVNTEIIQHGENGFLADTEEDWINYLSLLIENPELRKTIGENARKTVEDKYSVEANKHLYLQAIQQVLK